MLSSLTGKGSTSSSIYHHLVPRVSVENLHWGHSATSKRRRIDDQKRRYVSSSKPSMAAAAVARARAPPTQHRPSPGPFTRKDEPFSRLQINKSLPSRIPLTFLPTPLPAGESSSLNNHYFPNSEIQQQFSVMDALLKDGLDVPRAGLVFDRLRSDPAAQGTITVEVYNSFLGAYLGQALKEAKRAYWLKRLWVLFKEMAEGQGEFAVRPDMESFCIALLAIVKFSPTSPTPVPDIPALTSDALLRLLLHFNISVTELAKAPLLQYDLPECLRLLRLAAVEGGRIDLVHELGQATGKREDWVDPLEGVPEVRPLPGIDWKTGIMDKIIEPADTLVEGAERVTLTDTSPYNLQLMRVHLSKITGGREVLLEDAAARQRIMEESAYVVAMERWKHEAESYDELAIRRGMQTSQLKEWIWDWYNALETRLEDEIPTLYAEEMASRRRGPREDIGPYLRLLEPSKLALLTILELMRIQGTGGVTEGMKTARAVITIGRAVETEYHADITKLRRKVMNLPNPTLTTSEGTLTELAARRDEARRDETDAEWRPEWTQSIRAKIGSFLIDAVIDVAQVTRTATNHKTGAEVTEKQPAFVHGYEFVRGRKLGVIKLNVALLERLAQDPLKDALHPRQLPMLVPPRPWLGHESGGYLYTKTAVMRYKDSVEQLAFLRHASEKGNLEMVLAGLDVLGSTPWAVNKPVFDVILEVWNSGEALADIPPLVLDIPDPERPADYDENQAAKNKYNWDMQSVVNQRRNNHSQRCDVNYKLEIARAFLGERFYQPHNIDFRGRAYPIPPHLNHMSNDLCRGLLTFADKRALGESGLRWLKIHVANKFGYDKASFEERLNFTMEHLENVYDSAENPLTGNKWWVGADDPWQCLAACMELRAALSSGDPLKFESALPIHQDGTCNGLQHYAALGGDDQGARQVNLDVTDKPSDVYTFVADMVEARLAKEAEAGVPEAITLQGKIARKVVKQTVMTTVYGVTFVGARDQIKKQLQDRDDIPKEIAWELATYLARRVLDCIGDLFSGAKAIQTWLNQTARLISKSIPPERVESILQAGTSSGSSGSPPLSKRETLDKVMKEQMTSVIWTTPLGLPVAQPYRKLKKRQILTKLQSVFIADPNLPSQVNTMKQASAFPPNFVHSLDATHMMLTALKCRQEQITFASVHDSYWTHASSINEMSTIIRDTFVALHSTDVLGNLVKEIHQRYANYKLPVVGHDFERKTVHGLINIRPDKLAELTGKSSAEVIVETKEDATDEDDAMEEEGAELESTEADLDAEDVEEDSQLKPRKGKKKGDSARTRRPPKELAVRFVNLTDLLPPLPAKGEFDVRRIKSSLYFFS